MSRINWSTFGTFLFVLVVLGVLAFEQIDPDNAAEPADDASLSVEDRSVTVGESARTFRLVLPVEDKEKLRGLVLGFHGVGESAADFAKYSELDMLAADGWVVAYPEARSGMWLVIGETATGAATNRDVQFCEALIAAVRDEFELPDDLVLIGMSNGAAFAQLLAAVRPQGVTSVVAHSGSRPRGLPAPRADYRFLGIVGSQDLAAETMREDVRSYKQSGGQAELVVIEGLGHAWSSDQAGRIREFAGSIK